MNTLIDQPLVSILMTAYNRGKYIAEAIESVQASSYKNFELIVVDDCSQDTTVEIARKYEQKDSRIQVFENNTNLGDYPNRNKAASYAKGKYLKYLDSDDLIYPQGIEIMVRCMEKYPEAVLGSPFLEIQSNTPFPYTLPPKEVYKQHFLQNGLLSCGPSGTIIRRDYFEKLGGFIEQRHLSDTFLWLKICTNTDLVVFNPSLVWWRNHEEQEINIERKNTSFQIERFKADLKILQGKDVPLPENERIEAIRLLKKRQLTNITKFFIKGKITTAINLYKQSGMSFSDFIKSIPKNKFR